MKHRLSFVCGLFLLLASGVGCDKRAEQLKELGLDEKEAKRILAEMSARAEPKTAPPPAPRPKVAASASASADVAAPETLKLAHERWLVDTLVDVAPAAPIATHPRGVFMLDGQNRLWLAKLGKLSKKAGEQDSPVSPIPDNDERFPLGRGPSIAGDYAYWVSNHFLLRRPIVSPYEPLEVLTEDARVGTRASALSAFIGGKKRDWVAYIALPLAKNGPLRAKLWHGNDRHLELTPPSGSALSVSLVLLNDEARAYSLEARTGMSTVHSRRIVASDPLPALGEDQVEWVGGSAHGLSEMRAFAASPQVAFGLLPIERDITTFGMAVLGFDLGPNPEPATVEWADYENGLDPAPLDTAQLCGVRAVLYTRPSTREPHAPQELVLAELRNGVPQPGLVLAHSKAFYDVSLSAVKGGGILAYVADYRTWARTVRCQ